MLVISDSGKGGGGVILLAVFLSVCASAAATLLIHDAVDHEEGPVAPTRVIIPDVAREGETAQAEEIAKLKETVARLEKAEKDRVDRNRSGLDKLANIESDLRALGLHLALLGTPVPPALIAAWCEAILDRLELSDSARELTELLERRRDLETDKAAKRALESAINALRAAID